uniref:Zinc finger CHCC-type domain-containing protein n=1 Tax=Minutocellus polymorphus TaxID=265543 RepID=A0A7S0AI12_9STRA|mmetsp:Transcript_14196/g.23679  ORF Transcript_14196/g.23679 Transcript_14196/m.23679 type:complete len:127 (+) Transcript_14196:127-507(+)
MSSATRFAAALCRSVPRSASRSAGAGGIRSSVRPLSSSSSSDIDPNKSKYVISQTDAPYAKGKHRSNALELIEQQAVIEVEGDMAVCDGGGGALGHPLEYIKIGSNGGKPVACIYCGLKFKQKGAH